MGSGTELATNYNTPHPTSVYVFVMAASSGTVYSTASTTSSFTDLLTGDDYPTAAGERRGPSASGVPKFKSLSPPSLPISPSSYFANLPPGLSPTQLLDSPVLLSASNVCTESCLESSKNLKFSCLGRITGSVYTDFVVCVCMFAAFTFSDDRKFSGSGFQLEQCCQYTQRRSEARRQWRLFRFLFPKGIILHFCKLKDPFLFCFLGDDRKR